MTEFNFEEFAANNEIPSEISLFVETSPQLLPGEIPEQFFSLMAMMIEDLDPCTNIEWLVVLDLTSLWWDVHRYRRWKSAVTRVHHRAALEFAFVETDPARISVGSGNVPLRAKAKQAALEYRKNPEKRADLRAQLQQHGYDNDALNAGAMMEGLMTLSTIERLLSSARSQITVILREVFVRREFAERARKVMKDRLKEEERANEIAHIDETSLTEA